MLLTISTTHVPATDLGYLLHKHPGRAHTLSVPFGTATVVYPEARVTIPANPYTQSGVSVHPVRVAA